MQNENSRLRSEFEEQMDSEFERQRLQDQLSDLQEDSSKKEKDLKLKLKNAEQKLALIQKAYDDLNGKYEQKMKELATLNNKKI